MILLADLPNTSLFNAALRWPLTAVYLVILALVCVYGLHRYWLTFVYYRTRGNLPRPKGRFEIWPALTVQLPMYNEKLVAERIIEAACAIDYPGERLQIQVLDDSTDDSADIARRCAQRMNAAGHDVQYVHRTKRTGYKAGALNDGLESATGELIAVFDADFVPPPNILKQTVQYFTDERVGMVQTCWDHLNRDDSVLTRSQAIFLDGHFIIALTARNRSGRWMNFNGTAGVWRRQTIESAGGWQHDTLTEDVDLSYRAQLDDWRFVHLPAVKCPAELPPETVAFKSQQHRWSKGSIQTALKMLPHIMRSKAPAANKVEAFFHLTSPVVHPLMVMMTLLLFPVAHLNLQSMQVKTASSWILEITLFVLATASASVFYAASQRECGRSVLKTILQIPVLMAITVGISLNNARAVIEALLGHESGFVRTPKYAATGGSTTWRRQAAAVRLRNQWAWPILELLLAGYFILCIALTIGMNAVAITTPLLVVFAAGYLYVGLSSLATMLRRAGSS